MQTIGGNLKVNFDQNAEKNVSDHKNMTFLHSFITEERCPTAVRNWLYRTKVHRDIIDEYRGIRKLYFW